MNLEKHTPGDAAFIVEKSRIVREVKYSKGG